MEIGTRYIKSNFPKSVSLFIKYYFTFFAFTLFARLVFLAVNNAGLNSENKKYLLESLYLGVKFDLRLTALCSFPLFVILSIPVVDLIKNSFAALLFKFFSTALFIFLLIAYSSDFGFYAYLSERLSSSALIFFNTPMISLKMVWESYPVVWGGLAILVLAIGFFKLISAYVDAYDRTFQIIPVWQRLLSILGLFFVIILSAYGKFSYYPLRWSEAYFSSDSFISSFTLNPVLNFFDTMKYKKKNYNLEQVKKYYPLVSKYLGVNEPDNEKLNFIRTVKGRESMSLDHNVIVVMLESLASNKTSLTNNPLDPTPYLKKIAEESTVFTNHFTPTEATARGVFATVTSNPDLTIGKGSSSRNPFIINQHSLINELKHLKDKFYFLGGSASWGNIRGIFTNNINDIQIYEEGSYSAPRIDVWGISDADLVYEADKILKKQKEPFFAYIQTSGFHRPYTIPEHIKGFEKKKFPKEEIEQYGFHSNEELNSMRLQDFALGELFRLAKENGYYDKTIFVIYGDHGLPSLDSLNMPKGFMSHQLIKHHVPLVIHSKELVQVAQENKVASQVDIMPTVLGLIGVPYSIRTLGRDLFNNDYDDRRAALMYSWHAKPERFSLIDQDFLLMSVAGRVGLFQYKTDEPTKDVSSEFPEVTQKLKDLSRGLLETGRYLMYNNKKID